MNRRPDAISHPVPRLIALLSDNGPTLLEARRFPAATLEALKARGHEIREIDMTSGLQAIARVPGGYFGATDPRREGLVMGD